MNGVFYFVHAFEEPDATLSTKLARNSINVENTAKCSMLKKSRPVEKLLEYLKAVIRNKPSEFSECTQTKLTTVTA